MCLLSSGFVQKFMQADRTNYLYIRLGDIEINHPPLAITQENNYLLKVFYFMDKYSVEIKCIMV